MKGDDDDDADAVAVAAVGIEENCVRLGRNYCVWMMDRMVK